MTVRRAVSPSRDGMVPWPDEDVARYVARGYWAGQAIGSALRDVAARTPDAPALVDGALRLTHGELLARSDACACRLLDLGIAADDRVVAALPNSWESVVLTVAMLRAGIVPVMAFPAHRRHEIEHLAGLAEARAIVVPAPDTGFDHEPMAFAVREVVPSLEQVLVIGQARAAHPVDPLVAAPGDRAADAARLDEAEPDPRAAAVFLLSGGTTGLPKLIARTHDDYLYNIRRSAEVSGMGQDCVYLAALPIGHNFPLGCPGFLGALLSGGTVVVAATPEPRRCLDLIEQERVTMTAAVPAVAQRWLETYEAEPGRDLSSLRVLQVGGARLADEVAARVRPVLGATLQQVFGMAEGLLNFTRLDDPDDVVCGTQGRPMCPDDELLVVDPSDLPVPDGEPGVLLTRGPYTPRGYYRAPEHNGRAFTAAGWYRTGDIVRRRPDGNLVVEGRDKDMINRGGEKISAEEVENFAYQIPGVRSAAAVAMPDPVLGERVCLYLVVEPDTTVTLDDVHEVMTRLDVARFKFPERLELVDTLPATKVGKIDKKSLREIIARRLEDEA